MVFYGNLTTLQIFVEKEIKLPIITQKCCCCCCYIYHKNELFFTVKTYITFCSSFHFFQIDKEMSTITQLAQRRCDNVVTTSLLRLPQRCGTVENESCTDVSFRRCDNVALQRCQDVASKLLQRRHNIKH